MKKKIKERKKEFHKQNQEKKIGDVTIRAKRVYLIKMEFLLSEDSKLLLTILYYTFITLLSP